jgi:hypothetical protein
MTKAISEAAFRTLVVLGAAISLPACKPAPDPGLTRGPPANVSLVQLLANPTMNQAVLVRGYCGVVQDSAWLFLTADDRQVHNNFNAVLLVTDDTADFSDCNGFSEVAGQFKYFQAFRGQIAVDSITPLLTAENAIR